uniref:HMG box domain-containing protein n=1 Tax=Parascaris univalens TaxID=6257 RepID=A0A915AFE4_PARUN
LATRMRESAKPPVRGKTSPYGFFVKMCYEEHKKKYPNENVQVTEISKKCSEKWKTMSDDEKRRFFELAQKDAERYQAEVAAYGGEDMLRKRKRVKKDPNAPKRALSAFFFFSHDKRPEVQQQHPEWKVGQVAQELGRYWKALSDEERMVYERKALEDKERYAEEMRNYKQPKMEMAPGAVPTMPNNGMMGMGVPVTGIVKHPGLLPGYEEGKLRTRENLYSK